jgi:hypothetical protein
MNGQHHFKQCILETERMQTEENCLRLRNGNLWAVTAAVAVVVVVVIGCL